LVAKKTHSKDKKEEVAKPEVESSMECIFDGKFL